MDKFDAIRGFLGFLMLICCLIGAFGGHEFVNDIHVARGIMLTASAGVLFLAIFWPNPKLTDTIQS